MGMRPVVYHIIGVESSLIPDFAKWQKNFFDKYGEKYFMDYSIDIWRKLEENDMYIEFIKNKFKNEFVFDVIPQFDIKTNIFSIRPVYCYKDSMLSSHEILYSMMETNLIECNNKAIKIPYDDYSSYIKNISKNELSDIDFDISKSLESYKGKWARKYPNHPLHYFDRDFDFTVALFKNMGIEINNKDIQRYLVFSLE